jgi:ribosomal protein S18 acetylase RimI-like enzyme
MDAIEQADAALEAHWSLIGRWSKGELHEEGGLLWYETPLGHLPYNAVIRSRLPEGAAADVSISRTMKRFRERGVDCLWFLRPSSTPPDLGQRLEAHGLRAAERMTYMSLELAAWEPSPARSAVVCEEVLDAAALDTYTQLTADYWEIPEEQRALVAELQREMGPGTVPGHRYLAFADGRAVCRGYLSLAGPPGVAAIYGMSVRQEARGRGIATRLTRALVERAKAERCERIVLHSSDMAIGLYRRAGFREHCVAAAYATTALWSGEH